MQHVTVIYDRSACVVGWVANLSYISVELLYYLNGHTREVSWAAATDANISTVDIFSFCYNKVVTVNRSENL